MEVTEDNKLPDEHKEIYTYNAPWVILIFISYSFQNRIFRRHMRWVGVEEELMKSFD